MADHVHSVMSALEYLAARDLYGLLYAVGSRPLTHKFRYQLRDAAATMEAVLTRLENEPRVLLADEQVGLVRQLLTLSDAMPLDALSNVVAPALKQTLATASSATTDMPVVFEQQPRSSGAYERVVISAGRTIGIGDEILIAHAASERARALGITLFVESSRPDVWKRLGPVVYLGAPPFSAKTFVEGLHPGESRKTGYVFADFLDSEPCTYAPGVFDSCLFEAKWAMGKPAGYYVDWHTGKAFDIRYPPGMPENRYLESQWMAARVMPGPTGVQDGSAVGTTMRAPKNPRNDGEKLVLLQMHTTKPNLIFAPEFYADAVARLASAARSKLVVEVLLPPEPTSLSRTVQGLLEQIDGITVLPAVSRSLEEACARVASADLIVGVDTFSSHVAALAGVAQVTIGLPEHTAWRHCGASAFYLVLKSDARDLIEGFVMRASWMLQRESVSAALKERCDELYGLIRILRGRLLEAFENGTFRKLQFETQARDALRLADGVLGFEEIPHFAKAIRSQGMTLSLNAYGRQDALLASARWYHRFTGSDLCGAACAIASAC